MKIVWFGEVSPLWQKIKPLAIFLGSVSVLQNFELNWANNLSYWANFLFLQMAKYWKNNLTIWSHWIDDGARVKREKLWKDVWKDLRKRAKNDENYLSCFAQKIHREREKRTENCIKRHRKRRTLIPWLRDRQKFEVCTTQTTTTTTTATKTTTTTVTQGKRVDPFARDSPSALGKICQDSLGHIGWHLHSQ